MWEELIETQWKGSVRNKSYTQFARLSYLLLVVVSNITLMIYVFLNTRSIDFKEWIKDILIGYSIIDQYENASIFIIKNKFYKEQQKFKEQLRLSAFDDSKSENISIQYESDINNDYMENFKVNRLNEKFTQQILHDLNKWN